MRRLLLLKLDAVLQQWHMLWRTCADVQRSSSGDCHCASRLCHRGSELPGLQAVTPANVWAVDRWTFRKVLQSVSSQKLAEIETFLKRVKSFGELNTVCS